MRTQPLNLYKYSPDQLLDMVDVPVNKTSVGKALHHLHTLAELGTELDGGCDGLDALCYHLDGNTCKKAIVALNKVLQRFEEIEKDRILPRETE